MIQTNWQCVHTLHGHSSSVTSVVITPDGQTLASGSKDKTIKLWNLSTKEEIYTITGHSDIITSVVISPDGKTLASASEDTTIKLWNLRNGEEIRTLKWPVEVFYSLDILFSPDGKILLSSSADDYVSLSAVAFNLTTGDEIWTKNWQE